MKQTVCSDASSLHVGFQVYLHCHMQLIGMNTYIIVQKKKTRV